MAYSYRPMTRAVAANPYGNKLGPQTKGPRLGFLGGAGGDILDFGIGLWDNARYNRFHREDIVPHNQRVNALLNRFGAGSADANPIKYADTAGGNDVGYADSAFGDQSIRNLATTAYKPVVNGLTNLPGTIAGQTAGTLKTFGATANQINSSFAGRVGDVNERFDSLSSDLTGGYQERLDRARGIVNSVSGQQTADANRAFNEQVGSATTNLASSGLTGTTVGSSVRGGIERQRGDELRRIADQRVREQLGVEDTFGGAGLLAQERVGTAGLGELSANTRYGAGLSSELANNLAARGIDAAQLNSSTGLEALRQRGAISQSEFDQLVAARTTRLNTRTGRTDRGVGARQNVFGTAASTLGGPILVAPGATQRA